MKKILLAFIIILSNEIMCSELESIEPLLFDFIGIESKDNIITAYGTAGSALISLDYGESWEQVQVFDSEPVINLFIEDNRLSAFGLAGSIGISNDNGITWKKTTSLNDTITFVVKSDEGYYARTDSGIYKLNDKFEILQEVSLFRKLYLLRPYIGSYTDNRRSIVFFKDNLYALADSGMIYKYNANLEIIDSLSLKSLNLCSTCFSRSLLADEENIIAGVEGIYYNIEEFETADTLFKIYDNPILFDSISQNSYVFNISKNRKFSLNKFSIKDNKFKYSPLYNIYEIFNPDSSHKIGTSDIRIYQDFYDPSLNIIVDFTLCDNKLFMVSNKRSIFKYDINNSISGKISEMSKFGSYGECEPYALNDETLFLFTKESVFKTEDHGNTFKKIIPNNFTKKEFEFKQYYYDKDEGGLYLTGFNAYKPYLITTNDNGETFDSTQMVNFNLNNNITNISKNGDNIAIGYSVYGGSPPKDYFWIFTYNKDLKQTSLYRDSLFQPNLIYSRDTNSFLMLTNTDDEKGKYIIKFTSDKGKKLEDLKVYNYYTDTIWVTSEKYVVKDYSYLIRYNEIIHKGKKYWILFEFDYTDSHLKIELLDVETHEFKEIFSRKYVEGKQTPFTAVHEFNDTLYLLIDDTLHYTGYPYDQGQWKSFTVPEGGRLTAPLVRFGDKFLARYSDETHSSDLYFFRLKETDVSVHGPETEEGTYFYSYPPYPIPAKNIVRCLIYWDPKYNIDQAEITVFDMAGNKIAGREQFDLMKLSSWSGLLTWRCAGVPRGAYIIHIRHGNASKAIKVLISD